MSVRWSVIHSDGSVCMEAIDQEHAAAAAFYFDSRAATGAPMACSPHGVRCEPVPSPVSDNGDEEQR